MQEQQHDTGPLIPLDVYTKNKISATAKTAGAAAILSLLGTIISILTFILKPSAKTLQAKEGFDDKAVAIITQTSVVQMLISGIISVALFYTLYSFARLAKKGIATEDRQALTKGLSNLAGYFKIIGLLLLFSLVILFLSSLFAGLGAAI